MHGLLHNIKHLSAFQILSGAYIIFFSIQYPVSAGAATTIAFYAFILPAFIYFLYKDKQSFLETISQPIPSLLGILMAGTLIHCLILSTDLQTTLKISSKTLCTAAFIFVSIIFFSKIKQPIYERFFLLTALLGGACALISVGYFLLPATSEARLVPLGRASHPILGSFVYIIPAIFALYAFQNHNLSLWIRFLLCISICIIALMIALTQSRMAMLSFAVCISLGSLIIFPKHIILKFTVGMIVAGLIILFFIPNSFTSIHEYITALLARGDSLRFELWQLTFEGIKEKPLIGHGLHQQISHPNNYGPHNMYLGTAFHLGIPIALLLITIIGLSFWTALSYCRIKDKESIIALLLLINGTLAGITEFGELAKSPGPLWLIFWLPIAFTAGYDLRHKLSKEIVSSATPTQLNDNKN